MITDPGAAIAASNTALGIEFGSTRLKAGLIGPDHEVLATGGHSWENHLDGGLWSYTLDQVVEGLREAYASLVADVRDRYGTTPASYGSIGISGMMHGYLAFDADGRQIAPFRTWRNTNTGRAAGELTRLFSFNIPLRWSIAHLHQGVLDGEERVDEVARLTTLAGWVHSQLTGRDVLGIGDASGMFPIDSATLTYDRPMMEAYEALVASRVPWRLRDVLPTVLVAGEDAGTLTAEGAALIDPTGTLRPGIPLCPPEGDAGTGMIATNAIAQRTGNISCGTSVFLMAVLEKSLSNLHTEIDMVTTPDGSPVAMAHSNNGASEIDAWVSMFASFARLIGADVRTPAIYDALYAHALTGEEDAGGVMAYNTLSAEPLVGLTAAQPLLTHTPDARVTLANAVRAQLMSVFAAVRIGVDILREEGVRLDSLFAHGGLFKTPRVAQQILADSLNIPVSVGETAGEGGAWGIAMLARYRAARAGLFGDEVATALPLPEYLRSRVFADASVSTLAPTPEGVAGYERFLASYRAGLSGVEAIACGDVR